MKRLFLALGGTTLAILANARLGAAAQLAEPSDQGAVPAHRFYDSRVRVLGGVAIAPDEVVRRDAVAILGSLSVDGRVAHDAVAIGGNLTVDGFVGHNAVVVLGDAAIDGTVRG